MAVREAMTFDLQWSVLPPLLYLTAFATDSGEFASRWDIYSRDAVPEEPLKPHNQLSG